MIEGEDKGGKKEKKKKEKWKGMKEKNDPNQD